MKNIILILLLPAILQGQNITFPAYLTLQGNDRIQQERITIQINEKTATVTFEDKVLTHRIIKRDTTAEETILMLSCGGKLTMEYKNRELYGFWFSCPGIVLYSSIGFCEAVELGVYDLNNN
jgi:hypothetical protein